MRYYRLKKAFSKRDRHEEAPATGTVDHAQVISVRDPGADIRIDDIALLPTRTADTLALRCRIVRVRFYATGVQCDIEGDTAQGNAPTVAS